MNTFTSHTIDTAPQKSKPVLQDVQNTYGFIPNIFADMAESPLPIKIYQFAQALLNSEGTLTKEEVNLVQMAISVENGCAFCVPAHTMAAKAQFKTDAQTIEAIRNDAVPQDTKIAALVALTQELARTKGNVSQSVLDRFFEAGYTKEQVFEVLSIVAYKTITNYTSNLAGTQPNDIFASERWSADAAGRKAAE